MRKITLVKLENKDQDTWYRVNSKDIVKVSYIDGLKIIDKKLQSRYNIKNKDKISSLISQYPTLAEELKECKYADTYKDNYIMVHEIEEHDVLYFIEGDDTILDKEDILAYDKEIYYWHYDGYHMSLDKVSDLHELEVSYVGSSSYCWGSIDQYKQKNQKYIKINSFRQLGNIDTVLCWA